MAMGKLFKWLSTAVALRKQDITRRKAMARSAREDRELKITAAEERERNREQYLIDGEEKFKEEHAEELGAYEKYV